MYKIKSNSDGIVACYKTCLVAQENQQEHDIDYEDTFSLVAKMPTVRILLTIVVHHSWMVHKLNVSNTFLHCSIETTIYLKQPSSFVDSCNPNHSKEVYKFIYDLKEAH